MGPGRLDPVWINSLIAAYSRSTYYMISVCVYDISIVKDKRLFSYKLSDFS